jgi:DNA mismatch endonuclease, patch repair protein
MALGADASAEARLEGLLMTERARQAWEGVPEVRRRIMKANRRTDTAPERAVRTLLHARGFRFRVDLPIEAEGGRALRPDIVFPRQRLAVYIDGCYWHGCPEHGTMPATNRSYWKPKIEENKRRDAQQTARLQRSGWRVLRAWEHEDPAAVTERVIATLIAPAAPAARHPAPAARHPEGRDRAS